jgi:tRNA dimethylallyltransferase
MSTNKRKKLIVILGPTATGKSSLGVNLALKFRGEIISADSRQVYGGLNIGSNKITAPEMKEVNHHLIDVASPKFDFNVVRFQKMAYVAINNIIKKGKLPFLVGGSPLYLYAVTEGWVFPPAPRNNILRKEMASKNNEQLCEILEKLDPVYLKKIDRSNPHRLIRAIEISTCLGYVPPKLSCPLFNTLLIGLNPDPKVLEENIKKRLNKRIKIGLIDEINDLHRKSLSWKRLEAFGLEYRWGSLYCQGKIDKKEMEKRIIRDSIKLAKRQMTWFKKDNRISWAGNQKQAELIIKNFL